MPYNHNQPRLKTFVATRVIFKLINTLFQDATIPIASLFLLAIMFECYKSLMRRLKQPKKPKKTRRRRSLADKEIDRVVLLAIYFPYKKSNKQQLREWKSAQKKEKAEEKSSSCCHS